MRSNGASIALTASFHKVNIYLESHCDHSSTSRAAGSVVPARSVPRMPRRGRDIAVARTEAPHPQWSKWLSFGSYFVRNDALSCMLISFGHMAPESGRVALKQAKEGENGEDSEDALRDALKCAPCSCHVHHKTSDVLLFRVLFAWSVLRCNPHEDLHVA